MPVHFPVAPFTRIRVSAFLVGLAWFAPHCSAAVQASLPKPRPANSGAGSSGNIDISVGSPFTSDYDNYIIVAVQPLGRKLRVRVSTGPGYVRSTRLLALVDGSASGYHDTDSAQAAIRWTKDSAALRPASNCVITNAREQSPTRDIAADWTRGGVSRNADGKLLEVVYWDAPIPPDARHVDVLLVFTDILPYTPREHDDRTARGRKFGDVPAVIGSWSGELVNGKWMLTINRSDLTPPNRNSTGQKEYPTQSQIDSLVVLSQRIVKSRTGLMLVKRDFSQLSSRGGDRKCDTGFDIAPAK